MSTSSAAPVEPAAGSAPKPFDESKYDEVTEGRASILYPKGNKVFYNPVQQFNRDLSVLGIRAWSTLYEAKRAGKHASKKRKREESELAGSTNAESDKVEEQVIRTEGASTEQGSEKSDANGLANGDRPPQPYIEIIEALSATGLRAIRYGKEIPNVRTVIANDYSKEAVDAIRVNVEHNDTTATVKPNEGDANIVMYQRKGKQVHCVDLDPYGGAAPFMDAAVQSIMDGGLLLVTCTDLGVLAGNGYPEKCFSQYGGMTLYSEANHESALRLVLNMVSSTASKYGRSIEPLLSLSIDFYVRCFIRIRNVPSQVKFNASKSMIVYHCTGCGTTTPQPLGRATIRDNGNPKFGYAHGPTVPGSRCQHCNSVHHIAGPMWGGAIHDKEFISTMLDIHGSLDPSVYGTLPRIKGMLTVAHDELDLPFYVSLPNLSSIVRTPCPPLRTFISALLNGGYKVSGTHAKAGCIKTDAPYTFLWDVMRAWVSQVNDGKSSKVKPTAPGAFILKTLETAVPINFEHHPGANDFETQRKSKLVRYQVNPTENWGPKAKAK